MDLRLPIVPQHFLNIAQHLFKATSNIFWCCPVSHDIFHGITWHVRNVILMPHHLSISPKKISTFHNFLCFVILFNISKMDVFKIFILVAMKSSINDHRLIWRIVVSSDIIFTNQHTFIFPTRMHTLECWFHWNSHEISVLFIFNQRKRKRKEKFTWN